MGTLSIHHQPAPAHGLTGGDEGNVPCRGVALEPAAQKSCG